VNPSELMPQGLRVEAPDGANPRVALTGTLSAVATSTPSRVLESRFTSTYCSYSRDLFTQQTVFILSPQAPRKVFSSEGTYGIKTSSWSARPITIHYSMT
jgi:hypothetical protein